MRRQPGRGDSSSMNCCRRYVLAAGLAIVTGTGCGTASTPAPPQRAPDVERAVMTAFHARVHCQATGNSDTGAPREYGCYLPGSDPSEPLDAGCIVVRSESGLTYFSCMGPNFKGKCVRQHGDRLTVVRARRASGAFVAHPCPHHSIYDPAAVSGALVSVNGWVLTSPGCPGQEASEIQDCDPPPPMTVEVHVHVCAYDHVWGTAGPGRFELRSVNGRIFSADFFTVVQPGRCDTETISFGPIENARVDAYDQPTFVFRGPNGVTADWTEASQPEPG